MIFCLQLVDKPIKALKSQKRNVGPFIMDNVIDYLNLLLGSTIFNFLMITVGVCASRFRFFWESKTIFWPVFGFYNGVTSIFSEFTNYFERMQLYIGSYGVRTICTVALFEILHATACIGRCTNNVFLKTTLLISIENEDQNV